MKTATHHPATTDRRRIQPLGLSQAIDHMIEGCQIISFDYRYLYVNRTVAKQGRKQPDELLGRTMMQAYPGIEKSEMFDRLRRCMEDRKLQRMENEFNYPDGSTRWFELKMEPISQGALVFSEDITKRKRYEQALNERNERLESLTVKQQRTQRELMSALLDLRRAKDEINLEKITDQAILENIGEGLVAVDAHAKILMINKTAERLLGLKSADLKGASITRLPMLDSQGRLVSSAERPINAVLRQGVSIGPSFAGYYFVHKYKGKFPIGLTATPIRLKGHIIGAIEVFRDITKELEIDKAKTEFVSIASHQLRTPLGLMKWHLEAIEQEGLEKLSPTAHEYYEEVRQSNERVLKVVRELLSVSRIDQGRVATEPQQLNVEHFIRDLVKELMPGAEAKHIQLTFKSKLARPIHLDVDRLHLHEATQNLINNALAYTPSGGRVAVKLHKKTGQLLISIHDTGIGIAPSDQKKLFSKFFRADRAALNNPDGSGLGLYVVKSYAEEWGGKITVRSREGHGSTFTLSLPVKKAAKS